ncbi:vitamin K epoxide reductase family protein [Pontibacter sp. SGAir0037]|uniref:vitamin K epoxide reductase family protein n=1 Tax=Pontibacter sp. SGAir0037 TaxID=2571030 RepID=UPI00143DDC69|nr:vitamin K epoxide reductase family protein [Pontibacter sp. SGAir0037]
MNLSTALPQLNPLHVHQPVSFVISRLLRGHKINVKQEVLEQKLAEHPFFPSLLSISDVLHGVGITHSAFKVEAQAFVENFSRPVLVYLTVQNGQFAVVEQLTGGKVKIITESGDTRHYTLDYFARVWDGVVLELDPSVFGKKVRSSGEKGLYPAYFQPVVTGSTLLLSCYLLGWNTAYFSAAQLLCLLLSLAGVGVSWVLVLQHLNKDNVLVKQLCQSNTQEGCDTVLGSRSSQLTPWLSMAEGGLLFFAGTASLLLFFEGPAFYMLLAVVAPVFSLYAIYLQAFVLRQWCKLCMLVHGIVLLNLLAATWLYTSSQPQALLPGLHQAIAFVLPAMLWFAFREFVKFFKERQHYRQEYKKLKSNPGFFHALIRKQPKVHIPEDLKVFTLGNSAAIHELVFVSNPYCGPCAEAHATVDAWLEQGTDFKVTTIFAHQSQEGDKRRQFVEWISGIGDREKLRAALHDWYSKGKLSPENWIKDHQLHKAPIRYQDEKLAQWLNIADVEATPTFFINGYKVPETYAIEDLRYLISEVE